MFKKIVRLQKIGNSRGFIIPSFIIRCFGIDSKLDITIEENRIIINIGNTISFQRKGNSMAIIISSKLLKEISFELFEMSFSAKNKKIILEGKYHV